MNARNAAWTSLGRWPLFRATLVPTSRPPAVWPTNHHATVKYAHGRADCDDGARGGEPSRRIADHLRPCERRQETDEQAGDGQQRDVNGERDESRREAGVRTARRTWRRTGRSHPAALR